MKLTVLTLSEGTSLFFFFTTPRKFRLKYIHLLILNFIYLLVYPNYQSSVKKISDSNEFGFILTLTLLLFDL